ncbi:MAG: FecR domain-containing protein [Deltaproteobacteria bacterium]|nr:FecR domain-containing protein [Deltaproteobacteria bacterium]
MRRRVSIAAVLSVLLILLSYLVYWLWFERELPVPPGAGQVEAPKEDAENRIRVLSVGGKVERRKGQTPWTAVRQGDELQLDEAIRTGQDARAVLNIGKTAEVEIDARSEFSVKEISRTVSRVKLEQGRISAEVRGRAGSRLKVEARGTDAVAEADRGSFSVLASGKGHLSVATRTGTVRLSAKSKTVEVRAGTQSLVQPDLPPAEPEPIPPSLFLKVGKPRSLIQREKKTLVRGATSPGAVVSINGVRVGVDQSGKFAKMVALKEGKNEILVEAQDVLGRDEKASLPEITVDSKAPDARSKTDWGKGGRKKTKVIW